MCKRFLKKTENTQRNVSQTSTSYSLYGKEEDCLQNNEHLSEVKEKRKVSLWIVGISAFSLVIVTCLSSFVPCLPLWFEGVLNILTAIAASVLAGGIVAYTADIPSIVGSFKELMVKSLISNSYLENVDKDQLKSIKKTVVKNLHKNTELPESLLQLDANLVDIFDKPFYSFFNEIVYCHKKGPFSQVSSKLKELDTDQTKTESRTDLNAYSQKNNVTKEEEYVLKDITNEFELINPSSREVTADIGLRKSFDLPPGKETSDLFVLQRLEVSVDDSKPVDIGVNIETFKKKSVKRSSPETMTYDSTLGLVPMSDANDGVITESNISKCNRTGDPTFIPKENDSPSLLQVRFKKSVRVLIKYRMLIPVRDNHFTRRMRYSAESFLMSYSCEDNVQIHGQVLGTLVKQEKITIAQDDNHKNSIMIQCRDWLLPGNGIFIVLDDK